MSDSVHSASTSSAPASSAPASSSRSVTPPPSKKSLAEIKQKIDQEFREARAARSNRNNT